MNIRKTETKNNKNSKNENSKYEQKASPATTTRWNHHLKGKYKH